jgi:hypothetical protein
MPGFAIAGLVIVLGAVGGVSWTLLAGPGRQRREC